MNSHDTFPLVPMLPDCITGTFLRRKNRFSVEIEYRKKTFWIHSNNSGSMLGLLRPGTPVLASPALNPNRKLPFTLEYIWYNAPCPARAVTKPDGHGFWVGVNTSVPNRLLESAFRKGCLPFAQQYSTCMREKVYGQSRLDACFIAADLPPLWVECKNVTLVEGGVACFPDAVSQRGQKHLLELMNIAQQGGHAAMFYLVQRPDASCFAPASFIDPEYARCYEQARKAGVQMHVFSTIIDTTGIDLGLPLPLLAADTF